MDEWLGEYDIVKQSNPRNAIGEYSDGDTRTIRYNRGPLKGRLIAQTHQGDTVNGMWVDE